MSGNLLVSIIAAADRDVTRYKRGGRSCISTGEDHGRSVIRTSGSKLRP